MKVGRQKGASDIVNWSNWCQRGMQIVSSFVQSILVIFAFKSIFVAAQFVFRWMQMLFYPGSFSRHFSAHWLHQGGNTFHFSKRAIQRDMQIGRCCQKKYFQFATNCELRCPNMFSQPLTEKKTNKETWQKTQQQHQKEDQNQYKWASSTILKCTVSLLLHSFH